MKRFKNNWPDLLIIITLAILPCLFFWRLITPVEADRLQIVNGDFSEQYFPLRAFVAQEWVSGRIPPLWNPYLFGGQPALADIQSGALYPFHVGQALLLGWGGPLLFGRDIGFPIAALEGQLILHFSIAALGMYLFVRQIARAHAFAPHRARFAAVISSLTFTYSGYLTGFPVQQVTILQVSAWLPWVLWGVTVSQRGTPSHFGYRHYFEKIHRATLPALFLSLALLAGHPQTALYIVYLLLAYLIFQARLDSPKPIISGLRQWLTILALAIGLAAPQLLPTLEFIRHSVRADLSYEAVSNGLPLAELVAIIYPGYFGGSPQYVGLVGLSFAALSLVILRQRAEVWFWAAVSLLSLLLSFGGETFVYALFYLLTPGFEMVRQQERVFLLFTCGVAVLAGLGAGRFSGPLPRPLRQQYEQFRQGFSRLLQIALSITLLLIYGSTHATAHGAETNLFVGVLRHHLFGLLILSGVWVFLGLRFRLRRWWGLSLIALWLGFNLFTVNWQFNLAPKEAPFTPDSTVQFLQAQSPPFTSPPVGETEGALSSSIKETEARIVSGGHFDGGNSAAAVYQLRDLTGNTPLRLANVADFFEQLPAWRMWQLMNVRYVIADRDVSSPGLALRHTSETLSVFEMLDPFPMAWAVGQVEINPNFEQTLTRLSMDDFKLRETALVEQPLPNPLDPTATASITVTQFQPTQLDLSVSTTGRALLVISQIDYAGWQAWLNGERVSLYRVNGVLQGVVVPTGQHQLRLIFWPLTFWVGWLMAAVSAGVLGVGLWLGREPSGG